MTIAISLGASLQYIRGANQNLYESLRSNDCDLILARRKELSSILNQIEKIHNKETIKNSLVAFYLIRNLNTEADIATVMLSEASSSLSAALSLV